MVQTIRVQSEVGQYIVTYRMDGSTSENEFKERLKTALGEWFRTTQAGQEAWETSTRQFNIGDLCETNIDPSLNVILYGKGISELSVEFHQAHFSDWNEFEILADNDLRLASV